jgi:hypothetical protein
LRYSKHNNESRYRNSSAQAINNQSYNTEKVALFNKGKQKKRRKKDGGEDGMG